MTWQGTQSGEFLGIPPTGKRVTWGVFDMVRVAEGKIAEHWGLMDQLSLMQQLGVIPIPEQATT
jgi:predicted ester cyclase